jgi:hypothetical protein
MKTTQLLNFKQLQTLNPFWNRFQLHKKLFQIMTDKMAFEKREQQEGQLEINIVLAFCHGCKYALIALVVLFLFSST